MMKYRAGDRYAYLIAASSSRNITTGLSSRAFPGPTMPPALRILPMHVMMVMMMHMIMMTAARIVGCRRMWTVFGLLHPPFLLLRTSEHLLLLLLLLHLRRLLHRVPFSVISMRTPS